MVFIRISPVILMVFFWAGPSYAQQEPSKKLIILHTNDLHSRLNGFSPEVDYTPLSTNDDQTRGGFARIATLISNEREQNGSNVLVLDAGDFLMGTFFPMLEETSGFQLTLMNLIMDRMPWRTFWVNRLKVIPFPFWSLPMYHFQQRILLTMP
jgi:5'-nucleotidase/UDP-sugar diphosphatase